MYAMYHHMVLFCSQFAEAWLFKFQISCLQASLQTHTAHKPHSVHRRARHDTGGAFVPCTRYSCTSRFTNAMHVCIQLMANRSWILAEHTLCPGTHNQRLLASGVLHSGSQAPTGRVSDGSLPTEDFARSWHEIVLSASAEQLSATVDGERFDPHTPTAHLLVPACALKITFTTACTAGPGRTAPAWCLFSPLGVDLSREHSNRLSNDKLTAVLCLAWWFVQAGGGSGADRASDKPARYGWLG
jgi:hypothetical protein